MRLKGKKLAQATQKAIDERQADELARAERAVAIKVNGLLDRIKHENAHIVVLGKQIDTAVKEREALQARLTKLQAGDVTGLDEPEGDTAQGPWLTPRSWHAAATALAIKDDYDRAEQDKRLARSWREFKIDLSK